MLVYARALSGKNRLDTKMFRIQFLSLFTIIKTPKALAELKPFGILMS